MTKHDQLWEKIKKLVKESEERLLKKKQKAETAPVRVSANVVRRRKASASACCEKGETNGQREV